MNYNRKNKSNKIHFGNNLKLNNKVEGVNFKVNTKITDRGSTLKNFIMSEKKENDRSSYKNNNKKTNIVDRRNNENYELGFIVVSAILMFLVVESLSRTSITKSLNFIVDRPINALVNIVLLFIIYGISVVFRRKSFVQSLITLILIAISVISAVLMRVRGMPISPYDIFSYREAIGIANIFISLRSEIIALIIAVLVVALLVFLYRKDKKSKRFTGKRNFIIYVVITSIFIIVVPQLREAKIINTLAWDVGLSYETNGFTYSIANESISAFRRKPEGYSRDTITNIRNEVDKIIEEDRSISTSNVKPNIIVVQLEAFMDPTRIPDVSFNQDPMPNMRKLMNNYTSGYMNVPVVGGGTARTEYEILSGSNFDYLNHGEIPYHTFLAKKASVSIASNLLNRGYKTVAIHNFYKEFYNRHKGLANLGFQKFIPFEVMTNVEYTPMGWPSDSVLTKYITQEIGSNKDKPSFIFTISTQGHSRYPMGKLDGVDFDIEIVKSSLSQADQNQITYYANQVRGMDIFVGKLIQEVNKLKQPTLLVFYGDHLPALNVITNGSSKLDKFSSLFVVANNYGVKKREVPEKFDSYQLSTMVLEMANQKYGPMNLVHKYLSNDKDYQQKLKLVQYDILFGKKYFLKDDELPKKIDMKIGNDEVKLEKIINKDGEFYLKGRGFNRQVSVFINNKKVDADYIDENTLKLYDNFYMGKKSVFLRVLDNYGGIIQESEKINYKF